MAQPLTRQDIRIQMSAEVLNGLALHPTILHSALWTITHAVSGYSVIPNIEGEDNARRALVQLLESGLDWTREYDDIANEAEEFRSVVCTVAHDAGVIMSLRAPEGQKRFRFGAAEICMGDGVGTLTFNGTVLPITNADERLALLDLVFLLNDGRVTNLIP